MKPTSGGATDRDLDDIIAAEYPRLVGSLGLYTGDRYVAQDLAQEAIARAWRRRVQLDGVRDLGAYLHRIAFNLARSRFRRMAAERRAHERLFPTQDAVAPPDPGDMLAMRQALQTLNSRQRAAIVLRYFADLPYTEISAALNVPEPTARSLVRRGLQRLRTDLGLGIATEDADG